MLQVVFQNLLPALAEGYKRAALGRWPQVFNGRDNKVVVCVGQRGLGVLDAQLQERHQVVVLVASLHLAVQ